MFWSDQSLLYKKKCINTDWREVSACQNLGFRVVFMNIYFASFFGVFFFQFSLSFGSRKTTYSMATARIGSKAEAANPKPTPFQLRSSTCFQDRAFASSPTFFHKHPFVLKRNWKAYR